MGYDVTLEVDSRSALGEGPFWHRDKGLLYWVDIEGKLFHIYDPESGENNSYKTPLTIGAVVPASNYGFIAAADNGFYRYTPEENRMDAIKIIDGIPPGCRMNDGKCDPAGRFWAGTIGPDSQASLYRLGADYSVGVMEKGVTVSNGLVWDTGRSLMYYIDTPTRTVVSYNYQKSTGSISDKQVVIHVPANLGYPDGMTIDGEGKLWIALWNGGCLTRWDPDSGELLEAIDIPAKNVTSCAFGGEQLDTLFITTAKTGMSDDDLERYPLAGSLFSVKPGVKGHPMDVFVDRNPRDLTFSEDS
ncbi:MAG: SMP-30/gluconolactonase/LRE family protein [Spirochaetales bacterium]|nr:SMP-30/gluconolactonase/LRE family protein [Spirochaetales bacterium]